MAIALLLPLFLCPKYKMPFSILLYFKEIIT